MNSFLCNSKYSHGKLSCHEAKMKSDNLYGDWSVGRQHGGDYKPSIFVPSV